MKRTLVIAPKYPIPENDGASMRTMNFVRYFKDHGEVDILCRKSGEGQISAGSIFSRCHVIDNCGSDKSQGPLARLLDKVARLKTWSTGHFTAEMEQLVRKVVVEGNYDFILCRYLSEAYPLLKLDRVLWNKVILDVDDIVTDSIYEAETANFSGTNKVAKAIDLYVLERYNARCMQFGSILFCSDEDRQKAKVPDGGSKAHVVPNTLPVAAQPVVCQGDGYDQIERLLFVGTLKYPPNLQGLSWFIQQVFPKALELYDDLKLTVVGRNPPEELREMVLRFPQIEIYNDVPELAPYYQRCGVSIVPLLAGGGTRIKILESGFAGRPVISTAIGAYGLGMSDGKEILVFRDSQSFLDRYRSLREDRSRYLALTRRFSDFVKQNFSYSNFRGAMDGVVARLL